MNPSSKNILQYIAIFIALIGLTFFAIGGFALWEEISSTGWPTVTGTVVQSEIKRWPKRKSSYDYRAQFLYQYQVSAQSYTSERINTARNRYKSQMAGQEALAAYPVGKNVTVYYHPKHPERALLQPGLRFGTLLKTCLGLFLLMGGVGFALLKRNSH